MTTTKRCKACRDRGTTGEGRDTTPCLECEFGREIAIQLTRIRYDLQPIPDRYPTKPHHEMVPHKGSAGPADQLEALAEVLRAFAKHAEIDHVGVNVGSYYGASLDAEARLSNAYNTEEAIEKTLIFTTLMERPGTIWLGPARMRGIHSVRALEARINRPGVLGVRLNSVIDTTGSESVRSVARALAAARATKAAS